MAVLRYLGLARETTYNMAVPPPAAFHVDIASSSLDAPPDTHIIYEGGLSRDQRTHRPGFYSPSGNIVYAFDLRTIAFLLHWALGGYRFTAGTPLNTHEIWGSPSNVLPSFVARCGKDIFEHVFSGCVVNSLEIVVEGEWCMATADLVSARDSRADLQPLSSLLLPAQHPLVFHEVTASLRGADRSAGIKTATLAVNNNIDAEAGRSIGSRHPRRLPAKSREITLAADLWYESTTELEHYWGGTAGPATGGTAPFPAVLTFAGGAHGEMVVELPRIVYTGVQQQPSGRDEIVQSIAGLALSGNETLSGGATVVDTPIVVTVTNAQTSLVA